MFFGKMKKRSRLEKFISTLITITMSATFLLSGFPVLGGVRPAAAEGGYDFVTKWGSSGSVDGQFSNPHGITVDLLGNVYVADFTNHRIQKFDSNGNFITKWGSYGTADGQFNGTIEIAVDLTGNIYVADYYNHRIQKFDSNGNFITKLGSFGIGDGQFDHPLGIAIDLSGNVFVADEYNNRIQKFDSNGNFITKWGSFGTGDGQFDRPQIIAIDSSGYFYISDFYNHRIQKFDSNGNFITKWGSFGTGDGQFDGPYGITIDPLNNILVTDNHNNRVQKFDSNGTFLTKWGSSGTGDGQFSYIYGIVLDSTGNVFIADGFNDRIQKFSPTPPPPDTTPPLVNVTFPTGDPTLTGSVQFTATINDSTTGNSIIGGAEYFINTPGANGTGTSMTFVDGNPDSAIENVSAMWDSTNLPNGWHAVYIHAADNQGNWSNLIGYDIYVDNPPDFGDAPDPTYPSLLASNGARHVGPKDFRFGPEVDYEVDSRQIDTDSFDDGLMSSTPLMFSATVPSMTTKYVNILADLNKDGNWDDAGEWVVQNFPVSITNVFTPDPNLLILPETWIRMTITDVQLSNYTGTTETAFIGGETEDHLTPAAPHDAQGPSAIITSPTEGQTVSSFFDIFVEIDDLSTGQSPIAEAVYSIDGGAPQPLLPGDSFFDVFAEMATAQIDSTQLSNGPHTITVSGKDSAGNWGAPSTVNINVDNTPPQLEEYDFGDAPDDPNINLNEFRSLLISSGPYHAALPERNFYLGNNVDYEPDSKQIDNDAFDDGLISINSPNNGPSITFSVTNPTGSDKYINIFYDVQNNGNFQGGQDWMVQDFVVPSTGVYTAPALPLNAAQVVLLPDRWMRIMITDVPLWNGINDNMINYSLPFDGGETEDYFMEGFDFGDAPDPRYPSLLANNGARHTGPKDFYFGSDVDYEVDSNQIDDDQLDDGLVSVAPLTFLVTNPSPTERFVNVLADLNGDGDWSDVGELVVENYGVVASGIYTPYGFLSIPENTWIRMTITDVPLVNYDGTTALPFNGGETEDRIVYPLDLEGPNVTITAPTDGTTVGLPINIEAIADDTLAGNSPIDTVVTRINGGEPMVMYPVDGTFNVPIELVQLSLVSCPPITVSISVQAKDNAGNWGPESQVNVNVIENADPVAEFSANPNPAACQQPIIFDASPSTHPTTNRSIVSYSWDFGDGATYESPSPDAVHSYSGFGSYLATLTVTDDIGKTGTSSQAIDVNLGNNPPTAVAGGPYQTVIDEALQLDGSASFDINAPCGDSITQYEWDLNNDGDYNDAFGQTPVIPPGFFDPGSQLFEGRIILGGIGGQPDVQPIRLRVTDEFGVSHTDSVTIDIYGNNPVADFTNTPNPATVNQEVILDANSSYHQNPGRMIVKYEWKYENGGTFESTFPVQPIFTFTPTTTGPRVIELRVTDDNVPPKTSEHSIILDVNPAPNDPPIANAGGPYYGTEGDAINFDGTGSSDPDVGDSIVSYEWDLDYDGATFTADAAGASPVVTFPDDFPSRNIALRVTDSHGESNIDTTTLTVTNDLPVVSVTDPTDTGYVNESVTLPISFSDSGTADTHTVSINWGDGTTTLVPDNESNGSGTAEGNHAYANDGQYPLVVTVTDNDGGVDLYTRWEYITFRSDIYEPDNSMNEAKNLPFDQTQSHTFHSVGDFDWYQFDASAGQTFEIKTTNLGLKSDTYMILYDSDGNWISGDDDSGPGKGSLIRYTSPADATYYALLYNYNWNYGYSSSYDVELAETLQRSISGTVRRADDSQPVQGANLYLYNFKGEDGVLPDWGNLSFSAAGVSSNNGGYSFGDLPDGKYLLYVYAPWWGANSDLASQWWDTQIAADQANMIQVSDSNPNPLANVNLQAKPTITGQVLDELGQPVESAKVLAFNTSWYDWSWNIGVKDWFESDWAAQYVFTDENGDYSFGGGMEPGNYKLRVIPPNPFVSEWHQDKTNYGNANNVNLSTSQNINFAVQSDTIAPSGTVLINNDAPTTSFSEVTLNLNATDNLAGVSLMRFRNTPTQSWTNWEPYNVLKNWILEPGSGVRTAFAQFKDGAGNESGEAQDSINVQPITNKIDLGDNTIVENGERKVMVPRGNRTLNLAVDVECDATSVEAIVPIGGTPTTVALSEVPPGSDHWEATVNNVSDGDVKIIINCPEEGTQEQDIGKIVLIDPSGYVTDEFTGAPIVGATVTLYKLNDGNWEIMTDALSMEPDTNPQLTDETGHYGWDVVAGTYYVSVVKGGYFDIDQSRIVVVPPAVTDLDVELRENISPTSSNYLPANGSMSVSRTATVSANISDTGSGIENSTVTTGSFNLKKAGVTVSASLGFDGTKATLTPSQTLSYSTVYTATLTSGIKDKAGNSLPTTSWSFTTLAPPESTPPVTTATKSPAAPDGSNNWYKTMPTITLTSSEPGTTYYKWDSGTYALYTTPLLAPSGNHTLYYYSKDTYENTETANNQNVKVDLLAPSTSISSPSNNSYATGNTLSVKTNTTDSESSVANVKLYLNGTLNQTKSSAPYDFTVSTSLYSNGNSLSMYVIATDNAGYQTTSSTVTTKIDRTKPKISYLKTSKTKINPGSTLSYSYKIKDAFSPKADTLMKIINTRTKLTLKNIRQSDVSTNIDIASSFVADMPKGSYQIQLFATDKAGNTQQVIKKKSLRVL